MAGTKRGRQDEGNPKKFMWLQSTKTENVHLLNVNKVVRKNSKVTKTNKLGCISAKKGKERVELMSATFVEDDFKVIEMEAEEGRTKFASEDEQKGSYNVRESDSGSEIELSRELQENNNAAIVVHKWQVQQREKEREEK